MPLAKALLSVPNARASVPPSDFIAAGAGKRSAFPARLGGTTWRGSCALCCADGQEHPSEKAAPWGPNRALLALPAPRAQLQLAGAPSLVSQLGFMKQDAQAGLQILGSGRERGREERERWDGWSIISLLLPPLRWRGLHPTGRGGTALAPQLQPLLCSLVCGINAPHSLFLLPGNRARLRITPWGTVFCSLPRQRHMEYKARRAPSSGAGNRAAAERPAGAPPAPPS